MSENTNFPTEFIQSGADISTLAQQFVLNLFNQKNDPRLVFHTYRQANEIVQNINSLAQANGSTEAEWVATALAGWFYNVGHLFDYKQPAQKSVELAKKFFDAHSFPSDKQKNILHILQAVHAGEQLNQIESQMLSDAVNAVQFGKNFFENAPLLRLERELLLNQHYSKEEWAQFQMQLLLNTRFYTSYAKVNYEPVIANHLVNLRQRLEKQRSKRTTPEPVEKRFQHLAPRINSGAQTFFRTNYRNHINLSSIADNKANIMISVNAILISVIISVVSYRNMTETNPAVLMPAIIFLFTGLASLIFAVLAARPKVTSVINDSTPIEEAKKNIVFFGNFVSLKMERYEEFMDEMFQDSELLYGNMSRDLYHLGKVLSKKYYYLSISYNIFMVGFVATVIAFFIALFT